MLEGDLENHEALQNNSENFGNVPKPSETFGKFPNHSERTEYHTLTVREVARMFEDAGVARTERSIINWCRQNRDGVSRLNCFFDENEHKYFLTPQSVDLAIKEEKTKARVGEVQHPSEGAKTIPNISEQRQSSEIPQELAAAAAREEGRALRAKVRRLEIETEMNKRYIERLELDREKFIEQMLVQSKEIGILETEKKQLQQFLEAPKDNALYSRTIETSIEPREAEYTEPAEDAHAKPVHVQVTEQ